MSRYYFKRKDEFDRLEELEQRLHLHNHYIIYSLAYMHTKYSDLKDQFIVVEHVIPEGLILLTFFYGHKLIELIPLHFISDDPCELDSKGMLISHSDAFNTYYQRYLSKQVKGDYHFEMEHKVEHPMEHPMEHTSEIKSQS
jgi:hypothetical protein